MLNRSKHTPFSIIDIGSFSIRLVIYDSISVAARTVFNEKVIINLGKVVEKKGKIGLISFNLLSDILERFISISRSLKSENLVILATAAIRNAKNNVEFVNAIYKRFGIRVKVLTGEEEGILAALGVFYSHKSVNGIIGDLGGGSLELIQMKGINNIKFLNSFLVGHTVLKNIGDYNSLKVNKYIEKNLNSLGDLSYENFYAVGGSFRVVAKLNMYLRKNSLKIIQDYVVTADEIRENIINKFLSNSKFYNEILEKVTKSRRNSIPYAINVLKSLIDYFRIKKLFFSSSGIREGYIQSHIPQSEKSHNPFLFQVKRIADNSINSSMVDLLFNWIKGSGDRIKFNNDLLLSACWISNIAWDIHPEHRRQYAMERILWYPFHKITRPERIELSITMYFRHSNGIKDKLANDYYKEMNTTARMRCKYIGQCLRLAHHITGGISEKNLKSCSLKIKKDSLKLYVKEKHSLFFGEAIPRGLKNAAQALGLKDSEIKFN